MPGMNAVGTNTAARMSAIATTGPETCSIALKAASRGESPASMWCSTASTTTIASRSEEHTSELQSLAYLVCRLLLEKKNNKPPQNTHLSHSIHLPLDSKATTPYHREVIDLTRTLILNNVLFRIITLIAGMLKSALSI